MPSLVATTSTPARKPFVRTHYVRTKIGQLIGLVIHKWDRILANMFYICLTHCYKDNLNSKEIYLNIK